MVLCGQGALDWARHHAAEQLDRDVDWFGLSSSTVTRVRLQEWQTYSEKLRWVSNARKRQKVDRDAGSRPCHAVPAETNREDSRLLDTVGAVIMDGFGRVACAASSGGIAMKVPGRVGHAAVFGAGVWADEWMPPSNGKTDAMLESADCVPSVSFGCCTTGAGEMLIRNLLAKSSAAHFLPKDTSVAFNDLSSDSLDSLVEIPLANLACKEALSTIVRNCQRRGNDVSLSMCGLLAVRGEFSVDASVTSPTDKVAAVDAVHDTAPRLVDRGHGYATAEVVFGHTTPSMSVGWMTSDMSAPHVCMSRKDMQDTTPTVTVHCVKYQR